MFFLSCKQRWVLIHQLCHTRGLFECHGLIAGQAEFFAVYLLGNGERQVVPLAIAMLFVRGYRIVNHRLHTVVEKVLLQFVTTWVKDGIDVVDTATDGRRHAEMLVIVIGNDATPGVSASR